MLILNLIAFGVVALKTKKTVGSIIPMQLEKRVKAAQ
jgi:hypothetical protein